MGAVNLISAETAKRYQAVPVGFADDGALLLAMANPTNVLTIDDIGMMTGRRIRPRPPRSRTSTCCSRGSCAWTSRSRTSSTRAREEDGDAGLQLDRGRQRRADHQARALDRRPGDRSRAPPTSTSTPRRATRACCSASTACSRRPRPSSAGWPPGVVSRIKIMADLDISERRVPQDGRFALTVDGRRVDIRVVTLPLVNGEGVVLRILDKGAVGRRASTRSGCRPTSRSASRRRSSARTARCSSPGPRARASPRRCTPR